MEKESTAREPEEEEKKIPLGSVRIAIVETESEYRRRLKELLKEEKEPFRLDLTGRQLLDIEDLVAELTEPKRRTLTTLLLNKNLLIKLVITPAYAQEILKDKYLPREMKIAPALRELCVTHNCLCEINLELPNLRVLDLSYNSLEHIPDLNVSTHLEELMMNNNYVRTFTSALLPASIKGLEFKENCITIDPENEDDYMEKFVGEFAKFDKLCRLELSKNPVLTKIPDCLDKLAEAHAALRDTKEFEHVGASSCSSVRGTDGAVARIETMLALMEQIRKSPMSCPENMANLMTLANTAMRHPSNLRHNLQQKDVNSFFDQIDILHSTQHKYRKDMYNILAKLASIEELCQKSMDMLSNYMKSSRELQVQVEIAIEECLLTNLVRDPSSRTPYMLKALCNMAKGQNIGRLLRRLITPLLIHLREGNTGDAKRVFEYKQYAMLKKDLLEFGPNPEYKKCMLGVLAAALRQSPDNGSSVYILKKGSKEFMEANLDEVFASGREYKRIGSEDKPYDTEGELISLVLEYLTPQLWYEDMDISMDPLYDYVIDIVTWCSYLRDKTAENFYQKTYIRFIQLFDKTIDAYNIAIKKAEGNLDEDRKEKERIQLTCKRFAAGIRCFAVMIYPKDVKIDEMINDINRNTYLATLRRLLALVQNSRSDPLVLAAVCELAHSLFSSEQVIQNDMLTSILVEQMDGIAPLMQFLGKEKWAALYKQGGKYSDKKQSLAVPLIQEVKQQYYFDVFIAIVRLVNFFCASSRNTELTSASVIEKVNEALNASNREDVLFDLLKVQSIEVRVAVVECLNNVPLDQFSPDEMKRILSLIISYKSSTGPSVLVLAKLIWIMSKLVKDQDEKVGKEFRQLYAKKTIEQVIEILLDNKMATAERKEDEEALLLSCVHFLQCASMTAKLASHLASFNVQFCSILRDNENIHKDYPQLSHLEIERTGMGSIVANILTPFTAEGMLVPYSETCLRVLQGLARVLSGTNTYNPPPVFPGEYPETSRPPDPVDLIKEDLKERGLQCKTEEQNMWDDNKLQQGLKELNEASKKSLESNIGTFARTLMIDILINYLVGYGANSRDPVLSKYIETFSAEKFAHMNLFEAMRDYEKGLLKEHVKQKRERREAKKKKEEEKPPEDIGEDVIKQLIVQDLEKDSLAYTGRYVEDISTRGLSVTLQEGAILRDCQVVKSAKRGKDTGIAYENHQQRALVVSALMSCIYNAYFCGLEFRESILRQLRQKRTLLALTQLCFSTDWLYANIGVKYLSVARLAIRIGQTEGFIDAKLLELDEIVCTAACEMIRIMDTRIKNERKVPLKDNDNALIIQLSGFGIFLISQIKYLRFMSEESLLEEEKLSADAFNRAKYEKFFAFNRPLKDHGMVRPIPPQYRCAEFCLKRLLPDTAVETLVSFMFYFKCRIGKLRSKLAADSLQKLNSVERARLRVTIALGSYMCISPETKYNVLETIMSETVMNNEYIRKSYIQEVLNFVEKEYLSQVLATFINAEINKGKEEGERLRTFACCEYCKDKGKPMIPIILALTTRSIIIFKDFKRTCKECPNETICWEPGFVEDPIPLANVDFAIDMLTSQLFCIAFKPTNRGILCFADTSPSFKIFRIPERLVKWVVLEELKEMKPGFTVKTDPVFEAFISNEKAKYEELYMTYVQHGTRQKPGVQRELKPELDEEVVTFNKETEEALQLVCVSKESVDFYNLDLTKWQWIKELEKKDKSNAEMMVSRDPQKKQEDSETKRNAEIKAAKTLMFKPVKKEKSSEDLTYAIHNMEKFSEKEGKEPILRVDWRGNVTSLFRFTSDFDLQSMLNHLTFFWWLDKHPEVKRQE